MSTTAKSATLVAPNCSHWLELSQPFGGNKEELYPVVEIDLPRVGTVRAKFSVDRSEHSSGWTDWRIYAREVTPSNGIGESARQAINNAGRPLIEAWLQSADYTKARKRAAAYMVKRAVENGRATAGYSIKQARETLDKHRHELTTTDARNLSRALDALQKASELLEAVPAP